MNKCKYFVIKFIFMMKMGIYVYNYMKRSTEDRLSLRLLCDFKIVCVSSTDVLQLITFRLRFEHHVLAVDPKKLSVIHRISFFEIFFYRN